MQEGAVVRTYVRGINLILSQSGANTDWYLYNAHGDVVQLTGGDGTVTRSYRYDAFGNEQEPDPADTNPFRYTGEYYDAETGTYYLRARYYSPGIGRFITRDTVRSMSSESMAGQRHVHALSLNLYTYAHNNPTRFTDPTGHYVAMENIYNDERYPTYAHLIKKVNEMSASVKNVGSGVFGGVDGFYGGNQNWFDRQVQRGSACGPTAVANIVAYMATRDAGRYGALYGHDDFSKASFTAHMNDTIAYVNSTLGVTINGKDYSMPFGIWSTGALASKTKAFATSRGVTLTDHQLKKSAFGGGYNGAVQFVKDGLSNDRPVAMLLYADYANAYMDNGTLVMPYANHWMTITEMQYDVNKKDYDLVFSTWGESRHVDFNSTWGKNPVVGLMYFE